MPVPTASLQLSCPSCGEAESWSPWVDGSSFIGRCGKCQHLWRSPLPKVSPKVIVLDTNVLSEIAKLRMPDLADERRKRLEHWTGIVSRLKRAVQLQAIICPEQPVLGTELALTPIGGAIADVAREFSCGVLFRSSFSLERQQLHNAIVARREDQPVQPVARRDAFSVEIDQWLPRVASVEDRTYPIDPDYVREVKGHLHSNLRPVLQDWAGAATSLDRLYSEQLWAYGPRIIDAHEEYLDALSDPALDPDDFLCSAVHVMNSVRESLESLGVPREESMDEAVCFMESERASRIPMNQIVAALYAFEARQIAGSMRNLAPSFWLDVHMVSAVLPYCDEILTEGHLAGALRNVREYLPAECLDVRVFSVRELSDFESYLDELISAVPDDQRAAAEALYPGKQG